MKETSLKAAEGCDAAQARCWRDVLQRLDVVAWEADPETLRVAFVSQRAEELLGYSESHWLSDSGLLIQVVHPDDRDAFLKLIRDVAEDGQGGRSDFRVLAADGREFWFRTDVYPANPGRPVRQVRGLMVNVTEQQEANKRFHVFLESAPDAIVIVDAAGRIVLVNHLTEEMFGFPRTELLGQRVEVLVPSRYRQAHVSHRADYGQHPRTRPMGAGQKLLGRRKDGAEFPVEISLSPLETKQGTLVTSIIRDITERKRAEELIQASLREKEVLLKEIHHRVKNNLQVTCSLLKLQSGYSQDPQAQEMFAESQNRIRSMALVHEKLYQSNDLSRINVADYVESLAALLFRSYGTDAQRIRLEIEGSGVYLSVELAVPCGLIVNELLSNCLKHAFPEGRRGTIQIRIDREAHDRLLLAVADNGVGLPPALDVEKTETLGLQLVRTLAQQLDGTIRVERHGRTEFRIVFPEAKN